jgi:excisionase family DNA binding protein
VTLFDSISVISREGVKRLQNPEYGLENPHDRGQAPEVTFAAPLRLLTREELADALRVSPRTIQEMVSGKEIPVVRIRGAVRFYLPDVVRCLTASAVTSKRGCAHRLAAAEETPDSKLQTPEKLQASSSKPQSPDLTQSSQRAQRA